MASTSVPAGDTPSSQPVVFTTQTQYPLPSQKFMIPTTWKRYQLSQLINKALSLEKPVPFDFIVRGEVLRTTVSEWCSENSVGEEETLEIEYVESVLPPQKVSEIPHEDWVSVVSCQLPGYFLTTSYDGALRVFSYSKSLVSTHPAHNAPITAFTVIPSTSTPLTIATASHDLTVQLTEFTLPETPEGQATSMSLASLHLHTAPVSGVAASPAGTHLLTSSWDSLIGLWDTTIPEKDEVGDVREGTEGEGGRKKRRKVQEDGRGTRKAPVNILKGHTARVSAVTFRGEGDIENKAVSCGFDSTVRLWDVELGVCERTITVSEKPFLSLTTITPTTALATSTDRTLSLFDLRESTGSINAITASFLHPATPSCVCAAPTNPSQAVTGSYDGVVRVWDMRSTKGSIASFVPFADRKKILSVDWKRGMVGVGGEGGIEVWKVGEDRL